MISNCKKKHIHSLVSILSIFLIIGCQKKSGNSVKSGLAPSDSVLFTIKADDYEARFTEVSKFGKGSAEGDFIFQRRGSLDYILGELYDEELLTIENNPYVRKSFKIDIKWSKETDFKTIRNILVKKVQHEFGYTSSVDTESVKAYELNLAENKKLDQAMIEKNNLPIGVNFKINTEKNILNIIGTLPRVAKSISQKLDSRIVSVPDSSNYYNIELNLTNSISRQLRREYGLTLTPIQKSFRRITLDFK